MIEAMKQALNVLENKCEATHPAITALRQTIDAYLLSSKPPGLCMCGEPWRLESVHRKKSPCFDYIEHQWVGLTDEERQSFWKADQMTQEEWDELFAAIEAKLKEKNT